VVGIVGGSVGGGGGSVVGIVGGSVGGGGGSVVGIVGGGVVGGGGSVAGMVVVVVLGGRGGPTASVVGTGFGAVVVMSGAIRARVVAGGDSGGTREMPVALVDVWRGKVVRPVDEGPVVAPVVAAELSGGGALVVTRSPRGVVVNPAKIGSGGVSSCGSPSPDLSGGAAARPRLTFICDAFRAGNPSPKTPAPNRTVAPARISIALRRWCCSASLAAS
jgi:hypothetical protein